MCAFVFEKKNGSTNHISGIGEAATIGFRFNMGSIFTNIHKYTQIYTNIHKYIIGASKEMVAACSIWDVFSKTLSILTLLAPFLLLSPTNMK